MLHKVIVLAKFFKGKLTKADKDAQCNRAEILDQLKFCVSSLYVQLHDAEYYLDEYYPFSLAKLRGLIWIADRLYEAGYTEAFIEAVVRLTRFCVYEFRSNLKRLDDPPTSVEFVIAAIDLLEETAVKHLGKHYV